MADEIAAGRLLRVLPAWSSPMLSVDALMPARTRQPAKIRLALDVLRGYLHRTGRKRARPPHAPAARPRSA